MTDLWWDDSDPDPDDEDFPPRRPRRRVKKDRTPKEPEAPLIAPRKSAETRGQMPHFKRRCFRCHGTGRAPCPICGGGGKVPIGNDGNGLPRFTTCTGCSGTKLSRCSNCGGEGFG